MYKLDYLIFVFGVTYLFVFNVKKKIKMNSMKEKLVEVCLFLLDDKIKSTDK